MNKEKYQHSFSLDKIEEAKLDEYIKAGFTITGIVRLGFEKVEELIKGK